MKKAVFFDIDGTLWEDLTMRMPKSAKKAVLSLKKNGVYTFLCSGRTRCFIHNPKLLKLGFDGIVAGCGTQVDFHDKTIFYQTIPQDVVRNTVDTLRKYQIPVVLEGRYRLYVSEPDFKGDGYVDILRHDMGEMLEDIENNGMKWEVSKISIPMAKEPGDEVLAELAPWYDFLTHKANKEFVRPVLIEGIPKGISKATGIQKACEALDIAQEDTYAFGDSVNDVDMLRYAGQGVAMGNGSDDAKEAADYVTDAVMEDGVYNALKHFGLI